MDKHPTQKISEELETAAQNLVYVIALRRNCPAIVPAEITVTKAFWVLKDAMNRAEFAARCADVDETAGLFDGVEA